MLYDTRATPDYTLPGNAKIGWSAETRLSNLCLPVRGCDAAGFYPGDLLCARQQACGSIKIWKGMQKRAPGKSTLQSDKRQGGEGFHHLSTTTLHFRVTSFARCGVSVWVPVFNEMWLGAPAKENMTPPKSRSERKVSFTFDEAVAFVVCSTAEDLRTVRDEDAEVWEAVVRGLARST